jgi:hypothetical protein
MKGCPCISKNQALLYTFQAFKSKAIFEFTYPVHTKLSYFFIEAFLFQLFITHILHYNPFLFYDYIYAMINNQYQS